MGNEKAVVMGGGGTLIKKWEHKVESGSGQENLCVRTSVVSDYFKLF